MNTMIPNKKFPMVISHFLCFFFHRIHFSLPKNAVKFIHSSKKVEWPRKKKLYKKIWPENVENFSENVHYFLTHSPHMLWSYLNAITIRSAYNVWSSKITFSSTTNFHVSMYKAMFCVVDNAVKNLDFDKSWETYQTLSIILAHLTRNMLCIIVASFSSLRTQIFNIFYYYHTRQVSELNWPRNSIQIHFR